MSGAIFADGQQTIREARRPFLAQTVNALAKGLGHGRCHAFPCERGKLLRKPVRLFIFDIQAHNNTFLPYEGSFLPYKVLLAAATQQLITEQQVFWK